MIFSKVFWCGRCVWKARRRSPILKWDVTENDKSYVGKSRKFLWREKRKIFTSPSTATRFPSAKQSKKPKRSEGDKVIHSERYPLAACRVALPSAARLTRRSHRCIRRWRAGIDPGERNRRPRPKRSPSSKGQSSIAQWQRQGGASRLFVGGRAVKMVHGFSSFSPHT